jgi:hypothetical protein
MKFKLRYWPLAALAVCGLAAVAYNYLHRLGHNSAVVSKEEIQQVQQLAQAQGAGAAYGYVKHKYSERPQEAHDLAHVVGRISYQQDRMAGLSLCDESFAFGCYHGFMEELIHGEGETGITQARKSCEALQPEGRRISCVHGIGHGIMGYTGDPAAGVSRCSEFAPADQEFCQDGVFMEYYAGMSPAAQPAAGQRWDFCSTMSENSQVQCVRNVILSAVGKSQEDPKQIGSDCFRLSRTDLKDTCVHSLGLAVAMHNMAEPQAVVTFCGSFPEAERVRCVTAGAREHAFQSRTVETAQGICQKLAEPGQNSCLSAVGEMKVKYGF